MNLSYIKRCPRVGIAAKGIVIGLVRFIARFTKVYVDVYIIINSTTQRVTRTNKIDGLYE